MDNEKEIKKLLAAYYDGLTTDEEEQVLKTCFEHAGHVSPDLEADARWLRAVSHFPKPSMPEGMEERIAKQLDKRIKLEPVLHLKRHLMRKTIGIAAGLMLLIGTGIGIKQYTDNNSCQPQDTFTNTADAHKAVAATLIDVSNTLNDGLSMID